MDGMVGVKLSGANGYNNGVKLLNDACAAMYSNSSLGAVGRSVDIEDIESVSSYSGATLSSIITGNTWYPNIFKQEKTGFVDNAYGTTLGLSDQPEYVTGSTRANTLKGYETYYSYNISTSYMNSIYVKLFTSCRYWLASRCVNYDSINDKFNFRIFYVAGSSVNATGIYDSKNETHSDFEAYRPVVEIDLSKATIGRTGDGSLNYPYSIEAQ